MNLHLHRRNHRNFGLIGPLKHQPKLNLLTELELCRACVSVGTLQLYGGFDSQPCGLLLANIARSSL